MAANQYRSDSWQSPSPAFLASLPRDPTALKARLYADSAGRGSGPDAEAFVYAADLLRSGLVPADLRSSLFEVMAMIPGISLVEARVIDGRVVVVLTVRSLFGQTQRLIVDPEGGQVVGEGENYGNALTAERWVKRELVDAVPMDLQKRAQRMTCTVSEEGGPECVPA